MSGHPRGRGEPIPAGSAAPLDAEQARELTIQIREAIAAVEQAGALLADRVRRASLADCERIPGADHPTTKVVRANLSELG